MTKWLAMLLVGMMILAAPAAAQQTWVQVEAQPNLRDAETRARAYAATFPDVSGFRLSSGWYAIVLGPYERAQAERRLATLLAARQVPGDSYLSDGRGFGQRFWPVGGQPPAAGSTGGQPPASERLGQPPAPQHSIAEARESEAALSREEREAVQQALNWAGVYSGAIDASFGPSTRDAMAAWQAVQGYVPTGILTVQERDELLGAHRQALAELGLAPVREEAAGIEITLPMGLVEFARYAPPFVRYDPAGDSGVQVLLISQRGDQAALRGLYDMMQTMPIVPAEGYRELRADRFILTGQGPHRQSHTYAVLRDGLIKGFTLGWRTEDAARMRPALAAMEGSFAPFGSFALDPAQSQLSEEQRSDLLTGLDVRKPSMTRTGFYIDRQGRVLTALEAVQSCGRITLDETHDARVTLRDEDLGIAVLTPAEQLAPRNVAEFVTGTPRVQSEIAVAGFSFGGAIDLPTLTFGQLADLTGLDGRESVRRLSLPAQPGDAGGPVYDDKGAVLGMLLPRADDSARRLPEDVSFAAHAGVIRDALSGVVTLSESDRQQALAPEDLARLAEGMTVMVSCWN